jgi:sugar phosphate isomerase/epimerase
MQAKLAVQMYTVRDFTKTATELAQTLEKIRDIGYPAVQLSAVGAMNGENPEVSAQQARKLLDDNGLKCIATHRGWGDLVNNTQKEIEFHQTLGCDYTAIGSIPGDYGKDGADGYRRFVQDAAPVIEKLKAAGLRWGYHNHAFEFARTSEIGANWQKGAAPRTLYDIFIEEGGPDFLLEMDVYWVDHAGANPERVIERCKGKLPVIHIKDKEMAGNEPVMAPIGEGNLDWAGLIPALEAAGVEWYAVEQDVCRRDPFDCLKSSFEFLKVQ